MAAVARFTASGTSALCVPTTISARPVKGKGCTHSTTWSLLPILTHTAHGDFTTGGATHTAMVSTDGAMVVLVTHDVHFAAHKGVVVVDRGVAEEDGGIRTLIFGLRGRAVHMLIAGVVEVERGVLVRGKLVDIVLRRRVSHPEQSLWRPSRKDRS